MKTKLDFYKTAKGKTSGFAPRFRVLFRATKKERSKGSLFFCCSDEAQENLSSFAKMLEN